MRLKVLTRFLRRVSAFLVLSHFFVLGLRLYPDWHRGRFASFLLLFVSSFDMYSIGQYFRL